MNATNQQEVDPVIVHFGPDAHPMRIVDGAAALGYLFSLAQPPAEINWQVYWVPLCLVFSRCFYLAFLDNSCSEVRALSGVPVMANVMYLADQHDIEARELPSMFGTRSAKIQNSGSKETRP
jgi:hypothetical protein